MSPEVFIALSIGLVVVLGLAGWLGWRSRGSRQRDVEPPRSPSDFEAWLEAPMLYVATTRSGDPYDRITVHGLGFRARGTIAVGAQGVVLSLPRRDVLIPASDIRGVERATWTIDRVVESGGLLRIAWMHGDAELDVNVRITGEDGDVLDAIRDIQHPTTSGAAA